MKRVVCVGVILVACGGVDGTLPGDGGGSGPDASADDAAQQPDTAPAPDGATDAIAVDAPSCPSFCASTKSLFCSDFDGESSPTDWTSTVATGGGAATIVQSEDVSCPNGLHSSLPMITAQSGASAKVTKNIVSVSNLTHVVLDLDVYLPSNDTSSYVAFFGVRPTNEVGTGVYLTHHGDPYWFLTSAQFGNVNIGITIPPMTGAWNHMTLDVHLGVTGAVTLTYTGSDNVQHMVSGNGNTAANASGDVTVEVGMQSLGATEAAFDAYYDNVVLKMGT